MRSAAMRAEAMDGALAATIRINLLPREERAAARRMPRISMGRLGVAAGVALLAGALGSIAVLEESAIRSARTRVAVLTAERTRLQGELESARQLRAQRQELAHKLAVLGALERGRDVAARQIAALPEALPERLWLTGVTLGDSSRATFTGVALSPLTVADLVARLDSTAMFRRATLVVAEAGAIDQPPVTRFVVRAGLVP